MIVADPTAIPDTTPAELTVAIPVFELVHEPPTVASDRLVVPPTQAMNVPEIADGRLLTVTTAVVRHPVLSV